MFGPFNKQYISKKESSTFLADSICSTASLLSHQIKAKAIIVFTHSGYTAIRISSHRPKARIYAFTSNKSILNRISLVWGIQSFYLSTYDDLDKAINESIEILKAKKLLTKGDCVIHVGSTPLKLHGSTNMAKVSYV